jgi:hypothetical protein
MPPLPMIQSVRLLAKRIISIQQFSISGQADCLSAFSVDKFWYMCCHVYLCRKTNLWYHQDASKANKVVIYFK